MGKVVMQDGRAKLERDVRELKPGTVMVSVPTEEPARCFLCTAPDPSHKDACDAYLLGVVDGAVGTGRAPLCVHHETKLRELLVLRCHDRETFEKLGMTVKVV
jgi:hypothetical protein